MHADSAVLESRDPVVVDNSVGAVVCWKKQETERGSEKVKECVRERQRVE